MIFRTSRRQAVAGALLIAVGSAGAALAQQAFFRIGTGGTGGTYYPIGGLIANAISGQDGGKGSPASSRPRSPRTARSRTSTPSRAARPNWASRSRTSPIGPTPAPASTRASRKVQDLRVIATLYPETIHLVARKDANIKSVADLKGKRVSIDEPGSGTIVDARLVLAAFGITEKDIKPEYLKPGPAGDRLKDNALDAYFFVGGYPTGAISELATSSGITPRSDRRSAGREAAGANTSSSPRTRSRPVSTRTSPRRRPSRSTPSGSRAQSSRTTLSTRSPRRSGATRPASSSTPVTPRAS